MYTVIQTLVAESTRLHASDFGGNLGFSVLDTLTHFDTLTLPSISIIKGRPSKQLEISVINMVSTWQQAETMLAAAQCTVHLTTKLCVWASGMSNTVVP